MSEQQAQLDRVSTKIADVVLEFCEQRFTTARRLGLAARFRMQDLTDYVKARGYVAPDSPGRILRALRQSGRLDYEVIDRAGSLYEVTFA